MHTHVIKSRHAQIGWLVLTLSLVLVMILAGCQAPQAQSVATQAPPTPEPEPTTEPVVRATLDDMVGWWKIGSSMYMSFHIEPDGTWSEYGVGTDTMGASQISGPTYAGYWQPSNEYWEIHRNLGPIDKKCFETLDIQVQPDGSLRLMLQKDPCGIGHEEETFTRMTLLEQMFGSWAAGGAQDTTLALRADMSYAVWQGTDPVENLQVSGKMIWNNILGQVELRDNITSPCGPTKVGTYEPVIAADGSMTFKCIEDFCLERRKIMTEWGPFQRDETYTEIAGRYTSAEHPNTELLLTCCGYLRLRCLPDQGEGRLHEGSYAIQGSDIQVVDVRGKQCCDQSPGIYSFKREGDHLSLTSVEDSCPTRLEALSQNGTWIKVGDS